MLHSNLNVFLHECSLVFNLFRVQTVFFVIFLSNLYFSTCHDFYYIVVVSNSALTSIDAFFCFDVCLHGRLHSLDFSLTNLATILVKLSSYHKRSESSFTYSDLHRFRVGFLCFIPLRLHPPMFLFLLLQLFLLWETYWEASDWATFRDSLPNQMASAFYWCYVVGFSFFIIVLFLHFLILKQLSKVTF